MNRLQFSAHCAILLLLNSLPLAQAQTAAAVAGSLSLVGQSAVVSGPAQALSPALQMAAPADAANATGRDSSKNGDAAAGADASRPSSVAGVARTSAPTLFQTFVQEATGRLLPHFGTALFDAPQGYAADASLPVPAHYILGPGDEIRLQVWGAVDFAATLVLDRNGQVTVPKVGVVPLAGVALRDLEPVLRASLGKVFANFSLNANLGRLRSIQVYVMGQARQPGAHVVSSLSTLVNALFVSGGPSATGSMRRIELQRAGKTLTRFDLYDFIARGDKANDLPLLAGDVIVIPPVGARVAITGALDQAAIYELKDSATTVADLLALGGGVPALATTQKAMLERINRASTPPRQVQELALDGPGLQQTLRDGDVLTLLGISPAFANVVTLQGVVAAPMRYRWFEGMRLLDLIPERDALITSDYYKRKNLLVQSSDAGQSAGTRLDSRLHTSVDQINWDYAVIERLNRSTLVTELIPFNLGKAVLQRDPAHNLALQQGDAVTVMGHKDLRLPQERQARLVRVEGEVGVPGLYQALPGETLPQLVHRVGGLSAQAYLFGTEFSRESVRGRQQENLDKLARQLEAQLQAQAGSAAANRSASTAEAQAALMQQQQAQLRSQLDRLKAAKSNGRVALELDPQAQSLAGLPALPLEDGDRIFVPALPGFVAAFGAVNNDNVLIYRPGKTVADVIKAAGLTEDAEPTQAFVLRADGSVIARRDHSSAFLLSSFESITLMPGDTVVIPAQTDRESRYTAVVRGFKDWTQILSNLGLGLASLKVIGRP